MIHLTAPPDRRPAAATQLKQCSAFTLIELLVTITIIAVLISLVNPSVRSARDQARRIEVINDLKHLRFFMDLYRQDHGGRYPTSTAELGKYMAQEVELWDPEDKESFPLVWDDVTTLITHKTRSRYYVVEYVDETSFIICSYPKGEPYDYGSYVLCINEKGEIVEEPPDEAAVESEEVAYRTAVARLMIAAGSAIANAENPDDASQTFAFLATVDPQVVLESLFNSIQDDAISQEELRAFTIPLPDDSDAMREVRAAWGDFLQRIDPHGDATDIPLAEFTGDPLRAFSAENYGYLIDTLYTRAGVANSMTVKLHDAEDARLDGDLIGCDDAVSDFLSQLRAQTGKAVSAQNATLLGALVKIICPDHQSD
jgi:prepilin-type N-terminal cleavage/methylation domain-containing protein